jgi:hypothetical protein
MKYVDSSVDIGKRRRRDAVCDQRETSNSCSGDHQVTHIFSMHDREFRENHRIVLKNSRCRSRKILSAAGPAIEAAPRSRQEMREQRNLHLFAPLQTAIFCYILRRFLPSAIQNAGWKVLDAQPEIDRSGYRAMDAPRSTTRWACRIRNPGPATRAAIAIAHQSYRSPIAPLCRPREIQGIRSGRHRAAACWPGYLTQSRARYPGRVTVLAISVRPEDLSKSSRACAEHVLCRTAMEGPT